MLSNKSDFEGGEVELDNRDKLMGNKSVFKINYDTKGTVICFPSFVWHRVKPVTKGTRYSMPTWYLGDPFK